MMMHMLLRSSIPIQNLLTPNHCVEHNHLKSWARGGGVVASRCKGLQLLTAEHSFACVDGGHELLPGAVWLHRHVVVREIVIVTHGWKPCRCHFLQLIRHHLYDHLDCTCLMELT